MSVAKKILSSIVLLVAAGAIISLLLTFFKAVFRKVQIILEDNFDDGILDTSKWWVVGRAVETDGVIRLMCGDGEYSNITTQKPIDLGGNVTVEVEVKANQNKECFLVITNKEEEATIDLYNIGFDKHYGELIIQRKVNGKPAVWYPDANRYTERVDKFTGKLKIEMTEDNKIKFYLNDNLKFQETFMLRSKRLYIICSAMGKSPNVGNTDFDNFRVKKLI